MAPKPTTGRKLLSDETAVPSNTPGAAKGALGKKTFSLDKYKDKKGLDEGVTEKPLEWIRLSDSFQSITGLPGVPKGYITLARGFSNTGKSTTMLETAVGCQKAGILPVIIDTENSFDWNHARDIGLEWEEVVDEDTGEIKYEGFFIYVNNDYLINHFGKLKDKNRDEAVIEDVAAFMETMLEDQAKGDLDVELCFLWDSIGTLDCEQSVTSKSRNNQWNAGALATCFNVLSNHKIPSSRKANRKHTNTFLAVQKIWLDNMAGAGVVKHKGGEAMFYAARLILHFGGVQSHGTSRLMATANGRDYSFGIKTKFDVAKNQVTGVAMKGNIISTAHGFIEDSKAAIDAYKKEHKDYLLAKLEAPEDAEISVNEVETDSEGGIF